MDNSEIIQARRCSVDGCLGVALCRGWCSRHYDKWRFYGSPLAGKESRKTFKLSDIESLKRFLEQNMSVDPASQCWVWHGTLKRDRKGDRFAYGSFMIERRLYLAHRLSFYAYKGFDLRSPLCVCHKCDRPLCINPEHLFAGTVLENIQDMVAKGRNRGVDPEKTHTAKLNFEKAREIRRLHSAGRSAKELSALYPVGKSTIDKIISGIIWKEAA